MFHLNLGIPTTPKGPATPFPNKTNNLKTWNSQLNENLGRVTDGQQLKNAKALEEDGENDGSPLKRKTYDDAMDVDCSSLKRMMSNATETTAGPAKQACRA